GASHLGPAQRRAQSTQTGFCPNRVRYPERSLEQQFGLAADKPFGGQAEKQAFRCGRADPGERVGGRSPWAPAGSDREPRFHCGQAVSAHGRKNRLQVAKNGLQVNESTSEGFELLQDRRPSPCSSSSRTAVLASRL